jgi:putative ABC transport system permease protein
MSLALSTVIYEWRRYMAAVVALAFAGLLILAFVGMFVGMGKAFTATIDKSPADLMILPAKSESMMNTGGMPRRTEALIYMNPAVAEISDIDDGFGSFSNLNAGKDKKRSFVNLMAVDTAPNSLTMPVDLGEGVRLALSEPYAVAIDRTALASLGVKLGDAAAVNGHAVRVAAVFDGYPNMMQPQVMISRQTLRLLKQARPSNRIGPMLVRLRDPAAAEQVRDQLNAVADGRYRAWTRAELSRANEQAMLKQQIIGLILTFAVVLGAVSGLAITWQTLRGAILGNIKEFASLRALGVSMGALRLIVMEMSFWVGVAGLGMTALLVSGIAALAKAGGLPMAFPVGNVVGTGLFLLFIAVLSGLLSLGILKKSQPADLLR